MINLAVKQHIVINDDNKKISIIKMSFSNMYIKITEMFGEDIDITYIDIDTVKKILAEQSIEFIIDEFLS